MKRINRFSERVGIRNPKPNDLCLPKLFKVMFGKPVRKSGKKIFNALNPRPPRPQLYGVADPVGLFERRDNIALCDVIPVGLAGFEHLGVGRLTRRNRHGGGFSLSEES
ncbi:hypothetical protein MTYM_00381 [Methylococcales bacterium]|nr:hypothetical protein MTYM_00381 [Methylococcales bacterium]